MLAMGPPPSFRPSSVNSDWLGTLFAALWIAFEMMIAPGQAGSDARSDRRHRSTRLGAWLVSTLMDKRTKRGHTGQRTDQARLRGKVSRWGQPKAIAFTKHTRRKRPPASALPCPAAERSVGPRKLAGYRIAWTFSAFFD